MRGLVPALVSGLVVLALAGCSGSPGDGPRTDAVFPPRPVAVTADRNPPCTMLTPDQAARLGLRRPTPGQGIVNGQPSPGCTWLGSTIDYNVQFIPIGAEVALTDPMATITTVNGFGAVQNLPDLPGSPPICQVAVDVAPGQSIRVQANAVPDPPYGTDELCRRASEVASMVMTTVVMTAPR